MYSRVLTLLVSIRKLGLFFFLHLLWKNVGPTERYQKPETFGKDPPADPHLGYVRNSPKPKRVQPSGSGPGPAFQVAETDHTKQKFVHYACRSQKSPYRYPSKHTSMGKPNQTYCDHFPHLIVASSTEWRCGHLTAPNNGTSRPDGSGHLRLQTNI